MSFGATLRLLRVDSGLSLRELAGQVGVSSAYLSRVENGHDPTPTPDRLAAIAGALGLPAATLLELGRQTGPAVRGYLERVPAASSLFLEIARRNLGASQIARLHSYLDQTFPAPRRRPAVRLVDLLQPARVVLRLRCEDLDHLVEVALSRLSAPAGLVREMAARVLAREAEAPTALGGGFLAPHAVVRGAAPAAALVTLADPLAIATPDDVPPRIAVVLISPCDGRAHLEALARIARLAGAGVTADLIAAQSPASALAIVESVESLW